MCSRRRRPLALTRSTALSMLMNNDDHAARAIQRDRQHLRTDARDIDAIVDRLVAKGVIPVAPDGRFVFPAEKFVGLPSREQR